MGKKIIKKGPPVAKPSLPANNIATATTLPVDEASIKPKKTKGNIKGFTKKEKRKQKTKKLINNLQKALQQENPEAQNTTLSKPKSTTESLNSLKDLLKPLLTSDLSGQAQPKKLNDAKIQQIREKESVQFQSVINHPAFKANPLDTITEHLSNSIALMKKQKEEAEKFSKLHNNNSNAQTKSDKRKKKKKKNANNAPSNNNMDLDLE